MTDGEDWNEVEEARSVIDMVKTELAFHELDTGFSVRLDGVAGPLKLAVPLALVVLGGICALTSHAVIGIGILMLALVLVVRSGGGAARGLRLDSGELVVEGMGHRVPLQNIERVELTSTGLNIGVQDGAPIELELQTSLGARAWLGERVRRAVVAHGDFEDVPEIMARLRGERV